MCAMPMPGVTIGEDASIERLLALKIYDWPAAQLAALRPLLCASDVTALETAAAAYRE
ncbi:MAG: hypothetical protein RR101_11260 [Burkholderiaceae bacterium]